MKIYAFHIDLGGGYDDQFLMVNAIDENDAMKQLDKINENTFAKNRDEAMKQLDNINGDNQKSSFTWSSTYGSGININNAKKEIYKNNIKPTVLENI